MKKIYIFYILFIFINLSSCGYNPIFSSKDIDNNLGISIKDIKFKDLNQTNNLFSQKLKFFQKDETDLKQFNIFLDIKNNKRIISKNKVGDPETYNLEIIANVEITNYENNIVYSKMLKNNKNYNILDNKFDLKQEENIIINNLADEIVNEIISILFSMQ